MLRRNLLLASALAPAFLIGCASTTSPTVSLQMVQAYVSDLVNAVSAAAQAYLAGSSESNSPLVSSIVSELQTLNTTIQGLTDPTSVKSAALEVLAAVQQIGPFIAPFLGPAGPFIPLAVAVVEAFVQSLPAPSEAPPQPPAALHRMAATYHRGR